jgi:DNA-binding MarR family transcriptional regulator
VGIDFEEPSSLAYLDSKAGVYHSREDGIDRFDISFEHPALDGVGLYSLLKTAAPSPNQRQSGVLDDWNIFDDALESDEYRHLLRRHTILGSAWNEFALSRDAFRSVLYDSEPPRSPSPFVNLMTIKSMIKSTLRTVAGESSGSVASIVAKLEEAGVENAYELVIETIKSETNGGGRVPVSTTEAAEKRFRSWHTTRGKRWFTMRLFEELSDEAKRQLTQNLVPDLFDMIITDEGNQLGYPKEYLTTEPLSDIYAKGPKVRARRLEVKSISVPNRAGQLTEIYIPGSEVRVEEGPKIAPLISWVRDREGSRKFVIQRQTQEKEQTLYWDGILGAIVIAYLSPQVRANEKIWPKEAGIPGYKLTNEMGEAQVPVMALMQQKHFLQSDLIKAAESLDT